jgi:hypothetical protein
MAVQANREPGGGLTVRTAKDEPVHAYGGVRVNSGTRITQLTAWKAAHP